MYKKYLNVGFLLLLMISALNGCKKETKEQYPVVIIDKPLKQDVKIYGEYVLIIWGIPILPLEHLF